MIIGKAGGSVNEGKCKGRGVGRFETGLKRDKTSSANFFTGI
jgi:hypothetical protein